MGTPLCATEIEVGQSPRLLWQGAIHVVHVGMYGRMDRPMTLWLRLYVVGEGEMHSEAAADYIAGFSRQMGVGDATVEFRSDPWFINEIWSTWFPLFEEHRGNVPSEKEFNATKTLDCTMVVTGKGPMNECSWKGSAGLP